MAKRKRKGKAENPTERELDLQATIGPLDDLNAAQAFRRDAPPGWGPLIDAEKWEDR